MTSAPANRKGERADGSALHEGAPFNLVHGFSLPQPAGGAIAATSGKFNAEVETESSGRRCQRSDHSADACWAASSVPATGAPGAAGGTGGGARPNEVTKARNFGLTLSASRPAVTSMSI